MKTLTVMAWRRPEYTAATLMALKRCVGIEDYRVWIMVDHGHIETLDAACEQALPAWEVVYAESRLGCNGNTFRSLSTGFAESEYHIHLEDDCMPAADCLLWFEWAKRFGDDPTVFSVSAYSRLSGPLDAAQARPWFTPWGWATWKDRWGEMVAKWPGDTPFHPWGVATNHHVRPWRSEVYPVVARVQNIGRDDGVNNNPAQWASEQYNASWAGDSVTREWRMA